MTTKNGRIDIGTIRREQIVDAAVAVIAEQGLQNLSLSEIEKKVEMSRGQLMYYFKAKEDILLAVFDRMVDMMCRRHGADPSLPPEEHPFAKMRWLEVVEHLLRMLVQKPPLHPDFAALQYTFLAQVGHREDFRARLAQLYAHWRNEGCEHLKRDLAERPAVRPVAPAAVATLVQAVLHGLAMQTAVDPDAVDGAAMVELCLDMLSTYLWGPFSPGSQNRDGRRPSQVSGLSQGPIPPGSANRG